MTESIITAIMIISFLIVLSHQYLSLTYVDDMSLKGYKILRDECQSESFRDMVYGDDFTGILTSITVPGYYYNVSICDYSGRCDGFDPANTNSTVWGASHILSGTGKYEPRILGLYIWR